MEKKFIQLLKQNRNIQISGGGSYFMKFEIFDYEFTKVGEVLQITNDVNCFKVRETEICDIVIDEAKTVFVRTKDSRFDFTFPAD